MDGSHSSPRRSERVVFETDHHLVTGDVTLPPDGYQSRFSDAVNRVDVGFVPLVDAEIAPLDGGESVHRPFLLLSKAHVRMAYPA